MSKFYVGDHILVTATHTTVHGKTGIVDSVRDDVGGQWIFVDFDDDDHSPAPMWGGELEIVEYGECEVCGADVKADTLTSEQVRRQTMEEPAEYLEVCRSCWSNANEV